MKDNYIYYEGFEGEPEYTFCFCDDSDIIEKLHIWGGYFNDIYHHIPPENTGWTSIAGYYQYALEFYFDKWKVPDTAEALNQLLNIDKSKIEFPESYEVLDLLIELFTKAVNNNFTVYIEYF